MIKEIKIKNFMSFKDEMTFSFEADDDKTFEDYQVVEVAKGVRLLRFALVYGANASGKSNLLRAFDFLRYFWKDNRSDVDEIIDGVEPFLLDVETLDKPSEFTIDFYEKGEHFIYKLVVGKHVVESEDLYIEDVEGKPSMLFHRHLNSDNSEIDFNKSIVNISETAEEAIAVRLLNNVSFVVARKGVNVSLDLIDLACGWMRNGMLPLIDPQSNMFSYAGRKIIGNDSLRTYLLDFVHTADLNITGVQAKKEYASDEIQKRLLEDADIPKEAKSAILKEGLFRIDTKFEHTVKNIRGVEKYSMPEDLQSDGTRRIFGVESAIYETLSSERMLFIDELESSLHPELVELVLEKYLQERKHSQLLISTHYDPLLSTIDDLIRKDEVWFTEKAEDGSTQLYSLVEFGELDKVKSFQRSYRNGMFGGMPNIKR